MMKITMTRTLVEIITVTEQNICKFPRIFFSVILHSPICGWSLTNQSVYEKIADQKIC